MKVIYDQATDTLTVIFSEVPVAESDEDKEGVILDVDAGGIWFRWKLWMLRGGWLQLLFEWATAEGMDGAVRRAFLWSL